MTDRIIVRHVDRAPDEVVQVLAKAGVATVHEALGRNGLLDPSITPIQSGSRVGGSAITVACAAGDNMMVHAAVELVKPGDVLVVAVPEAPATGMVGDLLGTSLATRGCIGLVIDAGVRDVAELRLMNFPVWSRAIHAQGAVKETAGAVNVPVSIAGARVDPGDVIVADDDGVVSVPRARAREVADDTSKRLDREEAMRARLAAGELGLDIYGLRDHLESLGVRWVDRLDDEAPRK